MRAELPRRTSTEAAMAKAYWITTYRAINDPKAVAEYAKLAGPAISAAGGRFLVRGTPAKTLEAGRPPRHAGPEVDSGARARSAFDRPAHPAALQLLGGEAAAGNPTCDS